MAIICLSFGKYAVEAFVTECEPPEIVVKMVALLAMVVILYVNCYSVNLATSVQNVFTAAKLVAVAVVIIGGVYKICEGTTQHWWRSFPDYVVCDRNIATGFIRSPMEMMTSRSRCRNLWKPCSTSDFKANANVEQIRFTLGSTAHSKEGLLIVSPQVGRVICWSLSYVHIRRYKPAPGLILQFYGVDFLWRFHGSSNCDEISKPNYPRPYKVPIIIPYLVLVISIYLIVGPIIDKPTIEYLYATLFILGGMVFYVPFVHYKLRIPFMDGVTVFLQMLFEVAPTSSMFD
ncbi:hypothetical protein NQ317_011685 [Molorchus minor]|uniref:Uncharacterized protein n=1 Tax=Molorchus minor TaxID=1323400 RepID=A0ABQ9J216_9CUCU|nr:hypothetical protein NQ317_011685 [Molorchus minor]